MSIKCIAERYSAFRVMLRISCSPDQDDIRDLAVRLATFAETEFQTDGSNIIYGDGRWKGETENGATIEIVVKNDSDLINWNWLFNDRLERVSRVANVSLGVSCFATVESTTAFELYELSE